MNYIYAFILFLTFHCAIAQTDSIDSLINDLRCRNVTVTTAHLRLTLPITLEDVTFHVDINAISFPPDSIAPLKYIIAVNDSSKLNSFYSYFDGNYYSFENSRFREYHIGADSAVFTPKTVNDRKLPPIQYSNIFQRLVPNVLAEELEQLKNHQENKMTLHSDTLVGDMRYNILDVIEIFKGNVLREMEYTFTSSGNLPISYKITTNPGCVGEQSLLASFTVPHGTPLPPSITESTLISRFEDIFANYRHSTFSTKNIVGGNLPMFSLPTTSGKRFSSEDMPRNALIIAFLDSNVSTTPSVISDIDAAIGECPGTVSLLLIFKSKDINGISAIATCENYGNAVLMGGGSLAVKCGITCYPTILIADGNNVVQNYIIGYNNNIRQDVIQKIALLNKN